MSAGARTVAKEKLRFLSLKRAGRFDEASDLSTKLNQLRMINRRLHRLLIELLMREKSAKLSVKKKGVCRSSSPTSSQGICTSIPLSFLFGSKKAHPLLFSSNSNHRDGAPASKKSTSSIRYRSQPKQMPCAMEPSTSSTSFSGTTLAAASREERRRETNVPISPQPTI